MIDPNVAVPQVTGGPIRTFAGVLRWHFPGFGTIFVPVGGGLRAGFCSYLAMARSFALPPPTTLIAKGCYSVPDWGFSASSLSSHGGGYRHMARRIRPRNEPRPAAASAPAPAKHAASVRTPLSPS